MQNKIRVGQAIRQGDVLLVRVSTLPENRRSKLPENGRIVMEYGEATGHAHVLDPGAVKAYDLVSEAGGIVGQAIVVLEDTELRHEEHGALTLERGTIWERWYQVEDDGEAERRVLD